MLELGIKQYQLAEKLGMLENNLSRKLRYELSQEEKIKILNAIKDLSKRKK